MGGVPVCGRQKAAFADRRCGRSGPRLLSSRRGACCDAVWECLLRRELQLRGCLLCSSCECLGMQARFWFVPFSSQ
ncbi:hypothetical protein MRX96_043349 [Rhipicephalus microplus]